MLNHWTAMQFHHAIFTIPNCSKWQHWHHKIMTWHWHLICLKAVVNVELSINVAAWVLWLTFNINMAKQRIMNTKLSRSPKDQRQNPKKHFSLNDPCGNSEILQLPLPPNRDKIQSKNYLQCSDNQLAFGVCRICLSLNQCLSVLSPVSPWNSKSTAGLAWIMSHHVTAACPYIPRVKCTDLHMVCCFIISACLLKI